ncbi:CRISPR-associated protein, Csh2 family [Caldicellulosiruptor acetigenus I77R1B]|jgi:CRISPR-associated protein Csh2|uniref:CRISPR-associated protein, Csh2 family n=1 Tax=Caldicellulosiruptor acetigenus (strain ATCC 700853 / DSM 12137 / I77R1B) TaxID=632335 RepID=E4S8I2_CALA7|nr:type I-B CRISPR-associated protein Cas7/Csh2 [Caldicellulosiruptor acetigenus]ADQ41964.1 CRISPR-associated protein, Csh2 family [Caldicellulosiruptor acetigenus I77R1B]
MEKKIIDKNSEILFTYDAKLCNPNGDPDEENRPRMDWEKEINLVSDLRVKRYIRDYLDDQGIPIYVRKIDGKSVKPEEVIKSVGEDIDELETFIDIRLFGATIPIKGETRTYIGPVQFNWGYSLNKVELLEASITSHFASREKNQQGAIGKDYRVKYSFIAFSGIVSSKRAKITRLTEDDVRFLDRAMKEAIPLQATRSKIGQYPRLYMRVEYVDDKTLLGDLRDYIRLIEVVEKPRKIEDVQLDITALVEFLEKNKDVISKIYYFKNPDLCLVCGGNAVDFKDAFGTFELEEV